MGAAPWRAGGSASMLVSEADVAFPDPSNTDATASPGTYGTAAA
jgi:hypothetical protein